MIALLTGLMAFKAPSHVTLDVHGVGYVAYCSTRTLATLPAPGEAVVLDPLAVGSAR